MHLKLKKKNTKVGGEIERDHTLKSESKTANSPFVTGIDMFSFMFSSSF
jgi:hypothetical protein